MENTDHPIDAVILAAGASRRMGQPKQLLTHQGVPLLRYTALQVLRTGIRRLVVVLGAYVDQIAPVLADLPIYTAVNTDWEMGMSTSLRCGLSQLESPEPTGVLLLVGDQPAVHPDLLQQLLQAFRQGAFPIVASGYEGIAGVPAVISRQFFDELQQLSGDKGARVLFKKYAHLVQIIPFPEGSRDIDTPEDAQKWLENDEPTGT
mgnify:CR=1 FL=1